MLTLIPVKPETRTLQLRLAVVSNGRGGWAAVGWRGMENSEASVMAWEMIDDRRALVRFVDVAVEVPLPMRHDMILTGTRPND